MNATEVVFLPGFDGMAGLRGQFLAEMGRRYPVRAVTYPNRAMGTLNGYSRHASAEVPADARPVVLAESFSGLVAARWASRDPHVAALVLCGAFARNPMAWGTAFGATLPSFVRLGASLFKPVALAYDDPLRRQWAHGLSDALQALDPEVIGERLRLIAEADIGAELAGLRIPIVIVQFDGDQVIGARARRELELSCPGAQVLRIDGPHFALETRPRETAEAIALKIAGLF
jgi:pimeloyl-ACP methyl ester carboxylesterase